MWRTPKELRKGLGSVTLKINTQHIHVRPLTWDPVAPLAVSIKYRKQKNTHGPGLPLKPGPATSESSVRFGTNIMFISIH